MIFTREYETDRVAEIQRIIQASKHIEIENASPNASRNGDDQSRRAELTAGLDTFNQRCEQVEKVRKLKNALGQLIHQIDEDLELLNQNRQPMSMGSQKQNVAATHQKSPRPNRLPEKQFTTCDSMLTDLMHVRHFRTIYNIFVVILLLLLFNTVVHDFVADGSINVGLRPIVDGFRNLGTGLFVWAQTQLLVLAVFGLFRLWAVGRRQLVAGNGSDRSVRLWDSGAIAVFVLYQMMLIVYTVWNVFRYDLAVASSIAVVMELTRFLMKNHAFVRSNAHRALQPKPKTDDDDDDNKHKLQTLPTFSAFLYFLFAPTIVYRDSYPRTKTIRWRLVAWNALEVIGVVFYVSFIFERFLLHYFRPFGAPAPHGMDRKSLVVAIFGCVLPSTMANLCGFYCLLHAWMNGWAELLRFGDRQFYRDWWNAASFDVYYRTWNCVVHDWLYTYVYRDVYELTAGSKTKAKLAVFVLSAIFHELILSVGFRFFYPVLLTMFLGIGMVLSCFRMQRTSTFGNVFVWFAISFGNGLCISFYCMEIFARMNCEVDESDWREYFVPVSWRCNGLF